MRGRALLLLAFSLLLQFSDWNSPCHAAKSKGRTRQISVNKARTVAAPAAKSSFQSIADKYRNLTYRQILDENIVVAGVYSAERKELCDQLTTLRGNGYDVNQATRQFFALEDLVRTGQNDQVSSAFAQTRQCIAESVAKAQGVSVASSRTINWQR